MLYAVTLFTVWLQLPEFQAYLVIHYLHISCPLSKNSSWHIQDIYYVPGTLFEFCDFSWANPSPPKPWSKFLPWAFIIQSPLYPPFFFSRTFLSPSCLTWSMSVPQGHRILHDFIEKAVFLWRVTYFQTGSWGVTGFLPSIHAPCLLQKFIFLENH